MMYKHQTVVYNLYNAATTASNRAQKKATIPLPTLCAYRGGHTKIFYHFLSKENFMKNKYSCSHCNHTWSPKNWESFYRYYFDSKPCPKCNLYYSIYANFTDQEKIKFRKEQVRLRKELIGSFDK